MIGKAISWGGVLIVSILLSILPLPGQLTLIQPPWTMLLLFYLLIVEPLHWAWMLTIVMGYLLDAMHVSALGTHAFALALSLWLAALKKERFPDFSLNQQMIFVGVLCGGYEAGLCVIDLLLGEKLNWYIGVAGIIKALIAMILWPWLKIGLDECLQVTKGVTDAFR